MNVSAKTTVIQNSQPSRRFFHESTHTVYNNNPCYIFITDTLAIYLCAADKIYYSNAHGMYNFIHTSTPFIQKCTSAKTTDL